MFQMVVEGHVLFGGSGIGGIRHLNKIYSFQKIKQIFPKTRMPGCHCQDATDITIILKKNKKIVIRKK
jgi:hypothetical protein